MDEERNKQQVYMPQEIQKMLGIGRSKTYYFLGQAYLTGKPFHVLKVGSQYRIPKKSFDEWMCGIS